MPTRADVQRGRVHRGHRKTEDGRREMQAPILRDLDVGRILTSWRHVIVPPVTQPTGQYFLTGQSLSVNSGARDGNQPTENAMPSKATSHPSASRARRSSLSLSSAGFVLLMWMKTRRSTESPRSASMEPSVPDMDRCPMR